MSYTPVELRHVRVSRSLLGYNRAMVEQVIEEVADSFETAWRERGELTDQVDALEKQVVELKKREELLTHTLVAAEQVASDVREHAKREAELTLAEANQEARSITRAAQSERERLFAEARRVEALLRGALGMVEEGTAIALTAPAEEPPADPWPREDTREFEPVRLPPVATPEKRAEDAPQPILRKVAGASRDFDWSEG